MALTAETPRTRRRRGEVTLWGEWAEGKETMRSDVAVAPLTKPKGLDHINLHVRDTEASLRFYTEVLGLAVDAIDYAEEGGPDFVVLDAGPHNVFLMRTPGYAPPASRRDRGLNHVCIEVEPTEPAALRDALRARGVTLRSDLVWRGNAQRLAPLDDQAVEVIDLAALAARQVLRGR